ncbi:MAG: IS110 family transposase [Verrucomicrobiota bacterium]
MDHHLFIGIDRSDQSIDIHLLDSQGRFLRQTAVLSAPESLAAWVDTVKEQLPPGTTAALCIEQPCINLTTFFSQYPFLTLYLINPVTLKKYREAFTPSKAKDDKKDALHLAALVFEKHRAIRPWQPADPVTRKLQILTEKRRQLVDLRTSITNRLTQLLKEYFPQALDLTGKTLHAPLACDFLLKWPTLQQLQKARPQTLTQFYILHCSRRPKVIEERLQQIAAAIPLSTDPVILETYAELTAALAKQLATLARSIKHFDHLIALTAADHPDAPIFRSLPGAGVNLSARLLAFFGTDRNRYSDPGSVQKHSGVAPVTKQSGKMHVVHRRYACSKFWRQTFVEWAGQSVIKSLWAKAYYQQQKTKGRRHQSVLRGLAYKWIRILYCCWQNRQPYDEQLYLNALAKSSSPLIAIINELKKTHPKFCEQK